MSRPHAIFPLLLALTGCGDKPPVICEGMGCGEVPDYTEVGPHPVGHQRTWLVDTGGGVARDIRVEVWYPAKASGEGADLPEAYATEEDAAAYQALLDVAPADCPTLHSDSTLLAEAASGPFPVVVFSHCHSCTRFSSFTIAEHLASHGFVVLAPDHAGNTLFDELAGEGLPVNGDTLELRRQDLVTVLDALDSGAFADMVQADPSAVATLGHSFGSVTAGLVAQEDPRVLAAFGLAAPMENPLLPGVDMEAFTKPLALLVATEDHSIYEPGNELIRSNAEAAQGPTWLVELQDAGHWSVSDLVGLTEGFMPGCGSDTRQVGGADFDYPDPAEARATTAAVVTAFMGEQLLGHEGAVDSLDLEGLSITRP